MITLPGSYWQDGQVQLYLGDCREILPVLAETGIRAACAVADPPYGETALEWDRWPADWLEAVRMVTDSLWCFGSLRMFFEHKAEFFPWKLSQDVIWEKPRGTSFVADRFARVHEYALHWYQGNWAAIHHDAQREEHHGRRNPRRKGVDEYVHGAIGCDVTWEDDGKRLVRSVLHCPSPRRGSLTSVHPTEKPVGVLDPLIRYACPPGGLVVDPFAGSGSTLDAARCSGRRAIGIEVREEYAEKAAVRLSQGSLFGGAA